MAKIPTPKKPQNFDHKINKITRSYEETVRPLYLGRYLGQQTIEEAEICNNAIRIQEQLVKSETSRIIHDLTQKLDNAFRAKTAVLGTSLKNERDHKLATIKVTIQTEEKNNALSILQPAPTSPEIEYEDEDIIYINTNPAPEPPSKRTRQATTPNMRTRQATTPSKRTRQVTTPQITEPLEENVMEHDQGPPLITSSPVIDIRDSPELENEITTPDRRIEEPIPDRRILEPIPDRRSEEPIPDRRIVEPIPDERIEAPTPDQRNEAPTPDQTNELPTPDQRIEAPIPEQTNELPAPTRTKSPVPDQAMENLTWQTTRKELDELKDMISGLSENISTLNSSMLER